MLEDNNLKTFKDHLDGVKRMMHGWHDLLMSFKAGFDLKLVAEALEKHERSVFITFPEGVQEEHAKALAGWGKAICDHAEVSAAQHAIMEQSIFFSASLEARHPSWTDSSTLLPNFSKQNV